MSAVAPLAEVFTSFQGEGPLVGVRQLFVRVRGCDLTCRYCDTRAARQLTGACRVEQQAASEKWLELPGSLTAEEVLSAAGLEAPAGSPAVRLPIHSIALTGGEPLLYPDFALSLAQAARRLGLGAYLETAGHRPEELETVIGAFDYVSMDFKLASTLEVAVPAERFVRSYEVAQRIQVWVKMVVTGDTCTCEVAEACAALAEVSPRGPLILQPVTPLDCGLPAANPAKLHELYEAAASFVEDVRVIPQCHRLLGIL
jgi:7-carboxy-7-deazaguanine synthase